jgi:hypothetical protein
LLFSGGETLKNFQARFLALCELKTKGKATHLLKLTRLHAD